jgi:serine/threonine-protein kinase HipA
MKDKAARALFGTEAFSGRLESTRKELFIEGVRFTEGMSISGVQQKLSLVMDAGKKTLSPTKTGGHFILKPSPDPFPYCSEMEHLGMCISQLAGIETAQCGLIEFADGERVYVTRRFDRNEDSSSAFEAIEDLCSLSDLPKQSKYESSYEAAGMILYEAVGGKLVVMHNYFKRIALAYLVGNDDMHLKNMSVIRVKGNTRGVYDKLSPNYDVVPTVAYAQGGSKFLALDLLEADREGKFSEDYLYFGYYTYNDFMTLADKLSLPSKPADKALHDLANCLPKIEALITASYITDEQKAAMCVAVKERARALLATRQPA